MPRDNAQWIADLQSSGPARDAALAQLRESLVRQLGKALGDRSGVDDAFLDDAVQDALVRILDRLDQFAGRSQFLTWAVSIAIRVASGEMRRRRWRDVSLDALTDDAGPAPQQAVDRELSPDVQAAQQSVFELVHQLIHRDLTERQRTALLAEMKGMPQDEIARQLGSNRNAIYKLTHDARKKLKTSLLAAGYTAADFQSTITP